MPFKIQRVPRGLNDLLSTYGGQTPIELEDRVRGTLELLQFYGNTQRQLITASGSVAAGNSLTAPVQDKWTVLFAAAVQATNTATMTFLSLALFASGPTATLCLATKDKPQPLSTTGQLRLTQLMPYPMLFPPQTTYFAQVDSLGVDATVALFTSFSIGVLG